MIFFSILLVFTIGIFFHLAVIHFPRILEQTWRSECIEYLHANYPDSLLDIPEQKDDPTRSWRLFIPFLSLNFFAWDSLLFVTSFLAIYQTEQLLPLTSLLIFTWLVMTSCAIDARHQLLPDELTYILLWTGLLFSCWNLHMSAAQAILSTLIAYLSLFIIATLFQWIKKKEGLGQGDIKFFAALAAWTGSVSLPAILLMASLSALIVIFLRKIIQKKHHATPLAFGPFLGLGAWLALLWPNKIQILLLGL
ncbi:MAG: A24 family peptidase [Gammaproteobacteria bacterium]|nr:A24 family peptidase [Gammaproteobacteria bacterium]MCD8542764.1 A24 family peptidase [Gammaproteobacteria bacterium]